MFTGKIKHTKRKNGPVTANLKTFLSFNQMLHAQSGEEAVDSTMSSRYQGRNGLFTSDSGLAPREGNGEKHDGSK